MATTLSIRPQFDKIKQLVTDLEADIDKHDKGNHAAGVRVRKGMQRLKTAAQGVRETVVQK